MKILVLHASALHLGYLGCYGNEWIDTPNLDRLAAEGIAFDQHYADNPGATGVARGCWTGCYRFPMPKNEAGPIDSGHPDLPRLLEEKGISFVRVSDPTQAGTSKKPKTTFLKRTVRQTLEELDLLRSKESWLLWVDLPSLAPPWAVPEKSLARYFSDEPEEDDEEGEEEDKEPVLPWLDPAEGPLDPSDLQAHERLQNTYAAVVTHFDSQVGSLLEELEERDLLNEILLCFTATRGLSLGEHGIVGCCRPWLHDEVIHLPTIIRLPHGGEAGRRAVGLTQPVDLLPTLLEAFGLPAPSWAHGCSLWPLLRGEKEQVRPYACSGLQVGEAIEWALRTPKWGSILPVYFATDDAPRAPQLYVKPDDRWEVNDVRQHHQDLAEHLEQVQRDFVAATRQPGPLQLPELRDVEAQPAQVIDHLSGEKQ